MALGSTQPLTEMSTRNLPRGKGPSKCKADNFTFICVIQLYRKCGSLDVSQPYVPLLPVTAIMLLHETNVNNVTCQPIVGLRNRALLGSGPLNASRPNTPYATTGEAVSPPCRAVPSRTAPRVATQQAAMTSHLTTLVSEATPM
jgi:hypothetical protein